MLSSHPLSAELRATHRGKVVSAEDAVRLVRDGDTVATGGFVGIGFPEAIAIALEEHYLSTEDRYLQATGKPHNLTLVYAGGQGDGKQRPPVQPCRRARHAIPSRPPWTPHDQTVGTFTPGFLVRHRAVALRFVASLLPSGGTGP